MKAQIELLLVTVTKAESLAVLDVFQQHTGQPARLVSRSDKAYHDLGLVNGTQVWLVLSEMGAGGLAQGDHNVVAGERGLAVGGDFHGNVTIS